MKIAILATLVAAASAQWAAAPIAHPAAVPVARTYTTGVVGVSGTPLGPNGLPVGHVVPGPQIVGHVAAGPNVLPTRAHLPAAYAVEEAPIVNTHVEPVEQWSYHADW
jgi:hypothetical protein